MLNLAQETCHCGFRQFELPVRTNSRERVSSQAHIHDNVIGKLKFPYRKNNCSAPSVSSNITEYILEISRVVGKLNTIETLLEAVTPVSRTSNLQKTFWSVNKALHDAWKVVLKQHVWAKKLVPMTDASCRSDCHAFMSEYNSKQK